MSQVIKNPLVWFEIYVNDMERAVRFYEAVFEMQMIAMPPVKTGLLMYAFPAEMSAGGTTGALAQMEGVSAVPGSILIYFGCDDCAQIAKRAQKNGGMIVHDKFSIGEHGFIAMINDSEGNLIGLHSAR